MTRLRRVLLSAVVVVAACGIPTADRPDVASDDNVPFGLLDPAVTTTSTTSPPENPAAAVSLCLYQAENLVTVGRELPGIGLFDALRALERQTSRQERAQGLETAIPSPDTIRSASVVAGVARVDLAASFAALPAAEQLRVVAQVVCTATSRPGVGQVLFTLEGAPIDVPRGDGSLAAGAVTRDDYPRIVPRPA
jgi:hypothetical protein